MPKGPVETPITDQEIRFAHLVLGGKLTDREAAEAVGMSPSQAPHVKRKPRVKEYMASHRASVRAGLVQHEVDALAEFNIGREQILAKWWEFASIDPAKTGYNTSSQSKALDYLWNALGYADPDPTKPKGEEPEVTHNVYRAKWMRKPGDPDYEDDEGETAGGAETSTRSEPAISDPEPTPRSAWLAVTPQPPAMGPNGNTMHRTVGPKGPSRLTPGAFGRFQSF